MSGRELSAAQDAVRELCRRGEWAELAQIPEDDELPAYDDEEFWRGRTIDGSWLADLVTSNGTDVHRRGVLVRGARIAGGLDLEGAELTRRLALVRCQLSPHPIDLGGARARLVDLSGVSCGGLLGGDVEVSGSLVLGHGFRAAGPVTLARATIAGDLVCDGGHFRSTDGAANGDIGVAALGANGAHVTGNVLLRGAVVDGAVQLQGATIGGSLECDGARITRRGGTALRTDRAEIGGSVVLSGGFMANGRLRLRDAKIGGNFDCTGAHLVGVDGIALDADRTEVAGSLFLHNGFEATGEVRLVSVRAGGDLSLSGATLTHPGGTALSAARVRIAGSLLLIRGFSADGRVRLSGRRSAVTSTVSTDASRTATGPLSTEPVFMSSAGCA